MRNGIRRVLSCALIWLMTAAAGSSEGEAFRFVVVGDLPYNAAEVARIPRDLVPAIRAGNFPFVVHVGDLKDSGESCTDELLRKAHRTVMDLLPGRVFFTPGDNEWTDCDRAYVSEPMSELERLDFLRRLFFAKAPTLPAGWDYRSQPGYPENAIWRYGKVQFATLHVVGTSNGRAEILLDDQNVALDAVDRRDAANEAWVGSVFEAAETAKAAAVVLSMQADMDRAKSTVPCGAARRRDCDAFAALRKLFREKAAAFGKPVLLVHGDTSPFCLDRTFGGEAAPLFWRLNAAGDGIFEASVVTVDPADSEAPFKVRRLLTGEDVRRVC